MQLTVFSDDWGRHPSSCQHLIEHLLERHRVRWINTIGTRRPGLDFHSLRRAVEKLRDWITNDTRGENSLPANPSVSSPFMLPSFGSRVSRGINAALLTRSLRNTRLTTDRSVAVTTLPITADLVGRLDFDRWIYYCVDDLSEWPGLDKPVLESMERELVAKVDAVVTVSENLAERVSELGRSSHLLPHGVDLELWHGGDEIAGDHWSHLDNPKVVFWGVIDERLDFDCIATLSKTLSAGSIILAGPENNADPRLRNLTNVQLIGAVDYAALPQLAAAASVLIMPYRDAPVTRAMQPLKLLEYLSTNKPVICRDLPAVQAWKNACHTYETVDEFASLVLANIGVPLTSSQATCRQQVKAHGWARRAAEFERILLG